MPERTLEIKMLDPVLCKVRGTKEDIDILWHILGYEKERWTDGRFAKERTIEKRSYFNKQTKEFLTGFINRVIEDLDRKGVPFELIGFNQEKWRTQEPYLPGMIPRDDQMKILLGIGYWQRGYIKSPMGSGKTVIAGFIHSMFPGIRTLFLCHTLDLLEQSATEFAKWGFDVIRMGGGKKPDLSSVNPGQIVVSTVQTYGRFSIDKLLDYGESFDMIIVDECHHIMKMNGMYANILESSKAPIRIGLTATDENVSDLLEGYIGQKIGELTLHDGIESGVLAKPEIHWINVPVLDDLPRHLTYKEIYDRCIVNNRVRNRLIIQEVKKELEKGRSVLTLVQMVEHGNNLLKMAEILDIPAVFVWGETEKEVRQQIKTALEEKQSPHIIASSVWNEGINIRSLDVINNAAGGKNETRTIQKIGRGLRTTETKKDVILKDYLDGYKYLSHHAMMRMRIYIEFGWTMKGVK